MMTERLSIDHKDLLFERLKNVQTALSEYSFSNLFLFRNSHDYRVLVDHDIFIQGISYDGIPYLMPTSDIRTMEQDYLESMLRQTHMLFPIPEEWLPSFNMDRISATSMDGDTDYVYTVEKMSTYRGRKLHRKRNLLKNFLYRHEGIALPLTQERSVDAEMILNEWQRETGLSEKETDYHACLEALKLYDELVLCGGIYYANGEPAGFLIGEELKSDTFALHFAKARKRFSGIYQYMFNNFAIILPSQYKFINLEQDLDLKTIRAAKSSYLPDRMLRKFRITTRT